MATLVSFDGTSANVEIGMNPDDAVALAQTLAAMAENAPDVLVFNHDNVTVNRHLDTFYVTWRDYGSDDFMVTRLDLAPGQIDDLTDRQIVQMCWDAEYNDPQDGDEPMKNPFVGDNPEPFDFVSVVTGSPVFVR